MTAADLDAILGHRFADPALLRQALTHPSAADRPSAEAFERLEFLGDRVLGLVVADLLLARFPAEPEGELALRFVGLVRRETVADVAVATGLSAQITLGVGQGGGSQGHAGVVSDACEAVIGALYRDGGLAAARPFIERGWGPLLGRDLAPPKDAKTVLQEWAMARGMPLPAYQVVSQEGPAHMRRFVVEVSLARAGATARGEGSAKRAAERAAAEALLRQIEASP
ncbi:MAG: ribonuclease III [Alphaproteobacteria bacterium]|nr:ribonuclease III [Alphaproteobacteria bacterium]